MNKAYHIPEDFIDDLLARSDIVELINSYIPLKKKGQNYLANCPFHQEKTPSFTVSATKQFFHCFGCKASGNSISFIMQYEHLSFVDAIEKIANIAGITIPKKIIPTNDQSTSLLPITETACRYYQQQLKHNQTAINYLKSRNISGQIAKTFKIGYAPTGWDNLTKFMIQKNISIDQLDNAGLIIKQSTQKYYDRFRDRIMFPIRNYKGQIVGFGGRTLDQTDNVKYLNSPETKLFHKNQILYGLYELLKSNKKIEHLLVVEGYLDVLQLHENNIHNAVATMGTALTDKHINLLLRYCKKIIFCFDGDLAGFKAAQRSLAISMSIFSDDYDISFLFLPKNEDPDSYIKTHGKSKFEELINTCVSLDKFFFHIMKKNLNLSTNTGIAKFISQSLPEIDKMPDSIMKHLLLTKLAKTANMDIHDLQNYLKKRHPTKNIKTTKSSFSSTAHLILTLLIQYPHLASLIDEDTSTRIAQSPHNDLFIKILNLLHQKPNISSGALIEYWRNQKEFSFFMELAGTEIHIPQNGIEKEFTGLINMLEKKSHKKQIDSLIAKAKNEKLTLEESQQLALLIKTTKIKNK